jgi:ABC-type polysaccharide/polyol phosphate transport system ATPase subunit
MGEQIAISLKNISKCYKRYASPVDRLKELLLPHKSRAVEFWALRDINLDIYQGETLGIVGQNGSGKSTLLQIIAGTLTPSQGEAAVKGRVSALLELGSGFNPEFTGRQNVFFNGRLLGLTREEIEAKFDDIAAFAEIGSFIEQPVKTYSSGMALRLAFAVAASIDPEILIIDEALAVGDVKFQARCMKRIRRLRDQGTTILFVSHDTGSVISLCQRAVLLNQGTLLDVGTPKAVANRYIALLNSNGAEIDVEEQEKTEVYKNPEKFLALDSDSLLAESDVESDNTTSELPALEPETSLEDDKNAVHAASEDEEHNSVQTSLEPSLEGELGHTDDLATPIVEMAETEAEIESATESVVLSSSELDAEAEANPELIASESIASEQLELPLSDAAIAQQPEISPVEDSAIATVDDVTTVENVSDLQLQETQELHLELDPDATETAIDLPEEDITASDEIGEIDRDPEAVLTPPDAIAPLASEVIVDVSDVRVTVIPESQPWKPREDVYYQPQVASSTDDNLVDLTEVLQDCHLYRYGNQSATVRSVKVFELGQLKKATTPDQQAVTKLTTGSALDIVISLEARADLSDLVVGVSIRNLMGLVVYGTNTYLQNLSLPNLTKGQCVDVNFQIPCFFNKGVYTLTVGLHSDEGLSYDWIDELVVFEVTNIKKCDGLIDLNAKIEIGQPRHYTAV